MIMSSRFRQGFKSHHHYKITSYFMISGVGFLDNYLPDLL